jgi:hypothetical protein
MLIMLRVHGQVRHAAHIHTQAQHEHGDNNTTHTASSSIVLCQTTTAIHRTTYRALKLSRRRGLRAPIGLDRSRNVFGFEKSKRGDVLHRKRGQSILSSPPYQQTMRASNRKSARPREFGRESTTNQSASTHGKTGYWARSLKERPNQSGHQSNGLITQLHTRGRKRFKDRQRQ